MNRKVNSALGVLLGAALIILAVSLKNVFGTYFWIPLLIGAFIAVFSAFELVLLFLKKDGEKRTERDSAAETKPFPEYRRKNAVLTRSEAEAFSLLKELFGEKYEIFPQVPLVAVIDKITQTSYRTELFRVADFLIADRVTFAPLILIEIDDSSHFRSDRAERDRKVNEICERARLPIVRFSPSDLHDVHFVKNTVKRNMLRK